jgi:hypothetical protein
MVNMTFKLYESKINKIAVKKGMEETDRISNEIGDESKSKCPIDTSELIDSYYRDKIRFGFNVGYSSEYAGFVDKMPQKQLKSGKTHYISSSYKKYGKEVSNNEL